MSTISRFAEVEFADVGQFQLLPDRGIHWPRQRTLFVADTHLGKDATFRRNHIPVPAGSTHATLKVISRMLHDTEARRLVILGDMFHARSSLTPEVCGSLDDFFAVHDEIEFLLVLGNHDLHLGPLPKSWPVHIASHHQIDRLALSHLPGDLPDDASLMLCGHLHPAIGLAGTSDRIGKLPCYWLSNRRLTLPAIGDFTGTHLIRPRNGDRVWMIAAEQVIEHRRGDHRERG